MTSKRTEKPETVVYEAPPSGDSSRVAPEPRSTDLRSRLARQIIEFAQSCGFESGAHLPEQKLADALKVSRTPIRQALQFLEEMMVVESRLNRGFFLTRNASELQPGTMSDAELEEDPLYFRIAEDRLTGRLEARATESEMVRRYGVSRARLIRVLAQMTKEGWLGRLPRQGWEFLPMLSSTKAYQDSYEYRRIIEPAALRSPNYEIDPVAFAKLRAQQQEMLEGGLFRYSIAQTFQINSHFHETIVRCSQNAFLLDGIQRINRLRRLIEYRLHKDRARLVHECKDHVHLLDLIEAGKQEDAARFLELHLSSALKSKLTKEGRIPQS